MRILITGGHGFIGVQLLRKLLAEGAVSIADGNRHTIESITVTDVAKAQGAAALAAIADDRVTSIVGDLSDSEHQQRLFDTQPAMIVHLAAVVSAQAESDFDLGLRVNFQALADLLANARALERPPIVLLASSFAVYGGDKLPAVLTDTTIASPQSSYGTQKLMGEFLLSDYVRKGFLQGHALRFPTVVVRPGKANAAASSFASGIIREPLQGDLSVCPVPASTELWITSPSCVVDNIVHAMQVPTQANSQTLALPGLNASVADMLSALHDVAGSDVVDRVTFVEDQSIIDIVHSWPARFELHQAESLGFGKPGDMHSIIEEFCNHHIELPER